MGITPFAPFFLLFVLYALRGERQWALATLTSSFLQAASPLLIGAGGRITGIQTAYALLPVGVLHLLLDQLRQARQAPRQGLGTDPSGARIVDVPDALLFATTAIGVAGAILLPRVFKGVIHVISPSGAGVPELLHPASRNLIQALYMVCNLFLYVLVSRSLLRNVISVQDCIRAVALGAWCAIVLGLYQVAGSFAPLPWPSAIINSNLGYEQLYNQGLLGIRRMSSTFLEPSVLAMHFLGLFALFGLGCRRWLLGGALLGCLLISTSATAYVGLVMLAGVYAVRMFPNMNLRVVCILLAVSSVVSACAIIAFVGFDKFPGLQLILLKLNSHSGSARTAADLMNLHAIWDSWGLGVGIGSTRSSSFLVTFIACTGLPGLACLCAFFIVLIARGGRSESTDVRALSLGLVGLTLGWLVSIPDLTLAMVWIFAGMVRGATVSAPRRVPLVNNEFRPLAASLRPT